MNLNIFWGLYMLIFAVGMVLVWYFLSYKKRKIEVKCTEKTSGKIIRYSRMLYNNISLPVVEYSVNNVSYEVVGPKFKGSIIKTISNPFNNVKSEIESNLTTRDNLPEVLKLNIKENAIISITKSPLFDLYPIGSEVEVYYNPNKPKMAYVQRFVKPIWILNACLFIGILFLVLGLFFMFGPPIVPM